MKKLSEAYWIKRMEEAQRAALRPADELNRDLAKQYRKSMRRIEKDIAYWYQRFMDNENINMDDARQKLSRRDLQEFRWTLEDYIDHARENEYHQGWIKELENASAKYHIERLEAIKLQMAQEVRGLFHGREEDLSRTFGEVYKESFYHTAFEISKGVGVGVTLEAINDRQVRKILTRPWTADGKTFSRRIWAHQDRLIRALGNELSQAINQGFRMEEAIKGIQKEFDKAGTHEARRLIMTEAAYFSSEAQTNCFQDLGVEKYKYISTLDLKTSKTCQDLDGKVFQLKDKSIGTNAPPMHPHCRSTTAPYFEDMEGIGTRAARDPKTGKTAQVPREMTYREWYGQYVEG